MPSTITKHLLGVVSVPAGQSSEPHYEMKWKPESRYVVTGLSAKWVGPSSPEDIRSFLFQPRNQTGLQLPVPNYRIDWGVRGFSTAPLDSLFPKPNLPEEFAFDPVPIPIPLGLPGDEFIVRLDGTPVQVAENLGIEIYIDIRPMNT